LADRQDYYKTEVGFIATQFGAVVVGAENNEDGLADMAGQHVSLQDAQGPCNIEFSLCPDYAVYVYNTEIERRFVKEMTLSQFLSGVKTASRPC